MTAQPSHESTAGVPEAMAVFDWDGDEFASLPAPEYLGGIRGYRAGQGHAAGVSGAPISADHNSLASEHAHPGHPDTRRQDTEFNGHPAGDDRSAPAPVDHVNSLDNVVLTPKAAPTRSRQGSTGDDPTRAATMRRAFLIRPFDKGIADHPGTVEKVGLPSPLAATAPDRDDLAGGYPFAGGATGTRREGVGPSPNSFRIMPRAWDALLVNTGGPAVSESNPDPAQVAAASQRARSFRL